MEVTVTTADGATVASLVGELDANTAPVAQQHVLPLAQPGVKLILNMAGVPYMSSAGLRMLLSTYRTITGNGGTIVLASVTDDIKDTMSVTGFLRFFTLYDTVEAALQALN